MKLDGITELDVVEAITGAVAIYKTLRSTSTRRVVRREYLYEIQGTNLEGIAIYAKGTLRRKRDQEYFYFLISSKRAWR